MHWNLYTDVQLVVLYVDFKLDESYTPSKISIRAGDGFHNLKVRFINTMSKYLTIGPHVGIHNKQNVN